MNRSENNSKKQDPWGFLLDSGNEYMFLYPFKSYFEIIEKKINSSSTQHHHLDNFKKALTTDLYGVITDLVKRPISWEFTLINKRHKKTSFIDFLKNISNDHQMNILFNKYPVMKILLEKIILNYTKNILLFFKRINSDLLEIENEFCCEKITLKNFSSTGDSHCLGSRVIVALFVSVNDKKEIKVVYKPRSVDLEKKFQEYLLFINPSLKRKLKTTKIIDKGEYGWIEFINHTPIHHDSIGDFYYRYGMLMGICYSLNSLDIHYENMVACGEHPYLIDLECLFSSPINHAQLTDVYYPSIVETLMIPSKKSLKDNGFDFSPLLNHAHQVSPFVIYEVIIKNEYELSVEKKSVNITPIHNHLMEGISKKIVCPIKYIKEIQEGYADYIKYHIKNKQSLISFITRKFSGVKNRVLFKPTYLYTMIMTESYHPKLLSNMDTYLAYISQLTLFEKTKINGHLIEHEMEDLLNGDIPYFSSIINKKHIKNSLNKRIEFKKFDTGLLRFINKSNSMDNIMIDKDKFIISKNIKGHYEQR